MTFKYITLPLAALALAASPAQAETAQAEPKAVTWVDLCPSVGELAEVIMTKRQEGLSLSRMVSILEGATEDPTIREFHKGMAFMAFKEPHWSIPENRQRAVREFRELWELSCYEKYAAEK